MTTINGLPAHVLLVHGLVVLVPLTAVLLILCAVWRAARERFIWLVVALAAICAVLTPITTEAGDWLEHHIGRTPAIRDHAELGDTLIYFTIALLIAAVLLAVVHLRERRDRSLGAPIVVAVAILAIVAGVAATAQVYRIGDSGAHAVWGTQS
ncbi:MULTISPECIES: DUF2231 domain-containing protein [unclassified Nocardia]|uniref:DUF2231 domain-containing protein n=1 Tax=unclassified Nocardia TaxID=2637762 RepID=UPI001CE3C7AD|nr:MULTISPECIES: DUF2231 domain-containing protein [unclassified Nocardia]